MESLRPITDELLKDGQLLVLTFASTEDYIRAYSLLVKQANPISKDITEMQEIGAGGTVKPDKLGESGHNKQVTKPGNSVYRVLEENYPKRIYHFGQLWEPSDFKIWWENPNGNLVQGLTRDTSVKVGDDEGYIWSDHTKYAPKMPSTALETIIIPGVTPFIGFENSSPVKQKPVGYFYGKAYDVEVINSVDMQLAKNVALGKGFRRTVKTFGPLTAYSISLPDEWKQEVKLTPSEMVDVLRGG